MTHSATMPPNPAAIRMGPAIRPAVSTMAPPSITGRSGTRSSRRGKVSAASIDPPPKAASAKATWLCPKPRSACTITTVLTITIAPAAATPRFSASKPRRRGVARYSRMPRVVRLQILRATAGAGLGNVTDTTSAAEARKPITVPPNSAGKLTSVSKAAASMGEIRFSKS